jgi:hypothetical protein
MTSKSTRLTSFKSSLTLVPPAFICAFNSSICSRRMRPISLSVAVCPSESFSILKVTFVCSQAPHLNGCMLSASCNSLNHRRFPPALGRLFGDSSRSFSKRRKSSRELKRQGLWFRRIPSGTQRALAKLNENHFMD